MQQHHGRSERGEYVAVEGPSLSPSVAGRFGRLFRRLPVFVPDRDERENLATAIAEQMLGEPEPEPAGGYKDLRQPDLDNDAIPSLWTYFGQFIDHDITFDPASSLQRANDPDALVNFRTPRLDLDSLYGSGPAGDPFLYDLDDDVKLLVPRPLKKDEDNPHGLEDADADPLCDLPRNRQGLALTGDPRNDENTFVSQLHRAFIGFHNAVVDRVRKEHPTLKGAGLFKEAQRVTRWHYQWIVLNEYLPLTIGEELVSELLVDGEFGPEANLQLYKPKRDAFIPVEFSVGAFRFGHSQVRPGYNINSKFSGPTFSRDNSVPNFNGFRPVSEQKRANWPFLLDLDDDGPQPSRQIDTHIAQPLGDLPDADEEDEIKRSLPARNLMRGWAMELPDGATVARRLGHEPLKKNQLGLKQDIPPPLWFYVLAEAKQLSKGERLGPVGGRIVGEVLVGLIAYDPLSYLNVHPSWKPTLGTDEGFTLADLLRLGAPHQVTRP